MEGNKRCKAATSCKAQTSPKIEKSSSQMKKCEGKEKKRCSIDEID